MLQAANDSAEAPLRRPSQQVHLAAFLAPSEMKLQELRVEFFEINTHLTGGAGLDSGVIIPTMTSGVVERSANGNERGGKIRGIRCPRARVSGIH